MRYLLVGLMMSLLACSVAFAQDDAAENEGATVDTKYEVTGIPLYQGPEYDTLDVNKSDIENIPPEFHSFQHRPADEVGYSPLTLDDFRFPVPKRTKKEFNFERLYYPDHAVTVWHSDCHNYTVTAFFFTRDMVRDHIQRLIDEYYICEPDLVQQVIDYYAEVTPQCGEVISWVWFQVDEDGHHYADRGPNRMFMNYLNGFKDKFYLEFGLKGIQDKVDEDVREFLYQYQKRADNVCGPELKPITRTCDACGAEACGCTKTKDCAACEAPSPKAPCPEYKCNQCPEPWTKPGDQQPWCNDYRYHGFNYDLNQHYKYYPRKVIIEDITFDNLARAYRWKFAWRFNDCEVDLLKQFCALGERAEFNLMISDPHWYGRVKLDKSLSRDIMAAMDPNTWGNVWPASNIPFDTECCECQLPTCDGNCTPVEAVGWGYAEPVEEVAVVQTPMVTQASSEPENDFSYFPNQKEEKEVISVEGNG